MALPNLGSLAAASTAAEMTPSSDESNKKVRKPYTITKSRESWTEPEHDKFYEALQLFDRDWKKIEAFVGSKTAIQIRSHAQKYFLKVQKSGTNEHLPPPRPKRKAAHPYPQKASKIASPAVPDSGLVRQPDSSSLLRHPDATAALPSWTNNIAHADIKSAGQSLPNIYRSNNGSTPRTRSTVLPDFAQVYCFLGCVFDPNETDHLQRLKKMEPIDIETVLLLMRNLAVNLVSPEFKDHRRLLSSYDIEEPEKNNACIETDLVH